MPSYSFGRSFALSHSMATRTTGETENFIGWMGYTFSIVVMVPHLMMYWSTPTSPTVFPAGMSSTYRIFVPIIRTVRWMFLVK